MGFFDRLFGAKPKPEERVFSSSILRSLPQKQSGRPAEPVVNAAVRYPQLMRRYPIQNAIPQPLIPLIGPERTAAALARQKEKERLAAKLDESYFGTDVSNPNAFVAALRELDGGGIANVMDRMISGEQALTKQLQEERLAKLKAPIRGFDGKEVTEKTKVETLNIWQLHSEHVNSNR